MKRRLLRIIDDIGLLHLVNTDYVIRGHLTRRSFNEPWLLHLVYSDGTKDKIPLNDAWASWLCNGLSMTEGPKS